MSNIISRQDTVKKKFIFLIFYKDYYNLFAKYIHKSIENSNPYQIPFIGDPSFSSPTSSYEIISNTGKIIWDLFFFIPRKGLKISEIFETTPPKKINNALLAEKNE